MRLRFKKQRSGDFTYERMFIEGYAVEVYSPQTPACTPRETKWHWEITPLDEHLPVAEAYVASRRVALSGIRRSLGRLGIGIGIMANAPANA